MLNLGNPEEGWLGPIASGDESDARPFLVPGVRVRFHAISIKAVRAARRAVAEALKVDEEDLEEAGDELSRELIRRGIAEWEGIGDGAGQPAAVAPETVELFMKNTSLYEAADRAYVVPWSNRDREKNVSAGSPDGTSKAAKPAPATARKSVSGKKTGAASRTRKAKPTKSAKGAPISPTSPRPKRASKSGK